MSLHHSASYRVQQVISPRPRGSDPEVVMARHCRCCGVEVREQLDWCPLCNTRLVVPWRIRLIPWAVIALEVITILAIVSSRD